MNNNDKKHMKLLLRYSNAVVVEETSGDVLPTNVTAALLRSLAGMGYTLHPDVIKRVERLSLEGIESFHGNLIGLLKAVTGAYKNWTPMYPNFPKQVMEADEGELYLNAMMHYLGSMFGLRIMPDYVEDERFPLTDFNKLKVLKLAEDDTFHKIFTNLMSSPTSVSEDDMTNIEWYISVNGKDSKFPASIPHKEMLAAVVGICMKSQVSLEVLSGIASTATDVMRIAVAMSEGDVSLAEKTKFKKFKRSDRRFLLGCLEGVGSNMVEDMVGRSEQWKRLGEILHPSEYAAKFPLAAGAFKQIRNGDVTTFNSLVETNFDQGDVKQVVKLLKTRAGVFARRLDHVLRIADDKEKAHVISEFAKVASQVSTPVLLQVRAHFNYRDSGRTRVVFPKGSTAKAKTLDTKLPYLATPFCADIARACESALKEIYSEKEDMGKVYIDPDLVDYVVPFSQRSASKSLHTITRGSKLSLDADKSTLRFFIWWKGRDVDLSAILYDKDFKKIDQISYTRLRNEYSCHSGDITNAPDGACEFIDIDMNKAAKKGVRYVSMIVYSYTGENFNEIEDCAVGWMERESVQSGEIFEARTMKNKIDLTSESTTAIPVIVDLETRKVVWADVALVSSGGLNSNEGCAHGVLALCESIVNMKKHNLWDLFTMHVESRNGTLVDDIEDADQVFAVDAGITPFDFEKIAADYI